MKSLHKLMLFIFVLHLFIHTSSASDILIENGDGFIDISDKGVNAPMDADQNTVAHQIIKHGGDKEGLLPSMDISIPNKYGETPFTFWFMHNHNPAEMETPKFMLERYPELVYIRTIHGRTILLVGLKHSNPIEVIQFIYDLHPQALFIPDNDGNLPLHYAFQYDNNSEVIQFIEQLNPSARWIPNKNGKTPLDYQFDEKPSTRTPKALPRPRKNRTRDGAAVRPNQCQRRFISNRR